MSETTTTTGWHVDDEGTIHDHAAMNPRHGGHPNCRPVIVLDPADPAVRETIARTLETTPLIDRTDGTTEWEQLADAVLAALASATEGADHG